MLKDVFSCFLSREKRDCANQSMPYLSSVSLGGVGLHTATAAAAGRRLKTSLYRRIKYRPAQRGTRLIPAAYPRPNRGRTGQARGWHCRNPPILDTLRHKRSQEEFPPSQLFKICLHVGSGGEGRPQRPQHPQAAAGPQPRRLLGAGPGPRTGGGP